MHFLSSTFTNTTNDEDDSSSTMKCAQVTRLIADNEIISDGNVPISITNDHPKPKPSNLKWNEMIIKVKTISISNIDCLFLSGNCTLFQRPKVPFVPGSFVCGVVEALSTQVKGFKVGDMVVTSTGNRQIGGLAEYAVIDAALAVTKPNSVDVFQAAACNSAVTALQAVDYIKKDDRVLILGGSTNIGSAAISLAKSYIGASFIATTSIQKDIRTTLGADIVINDNEENWWEVREFQIDKFDKIIDTVGGGDKNFYGKAELVLKAGVYDGHFIDATGNYPTAATNMPSWLGAATHYINSARKPLWTRTRIGKDLYPVYTSLAVPPHRGDVAHLLYRVLELMEEEKFEVRIDPSSPSGFTQDGIVKVFNMVRSGHAQGSVVIQINT